MAFSICKGSSNDSSHEYECGLPWKSFNSAYSTVSMRLAVNWIESNKGNFSPDFLLHSRFHEAMAHQSDCRRGDSKLWKYLNVMRRRQRQKEPGVERIFERKWIFLKLLFVDFLRRLLTTFSHPFRVFRERFRSFAWFDDSFQFACHRQQMLL